MCHINVDSKYAMKKRETCGDLLVIDSSLMYYKMNDSGLDLLSNVLKVLLFLWIWDIENSGFVVCSFIRFVWVRSTLEKKLSVIILL